MQSAAQDVRRPRSTATADKPFATLSHARACDHDAAENLEDVDACASRFVSQHCAAGSDRAWLRDRRQAPRRASTRRLGEDAQAWWRHDDSSSGIGLDYWFGPPRAFIFSKDSWLAQEFGQPITWFP